MEEYWVVEGDSLLEFKVVKTNEQTAGSEFYLVDGPFDTHEEAEAAINLIYEELSDESDRNNLDILEERLMAYEEDPNLAG